MLRCILCGGSQFQRLFRRKDGRKVMVCRRCGLAQVVPRPSVHEVAELYHEDLDHFKPYLEQIEVHRKYFRKKLEQVVKVARGESAEVGMSLLRLRQASLHRGNLFMKEGRGGLRKTPHLPELSKSFQRAAAKISLLDVGCAMGVLLDEAGKLGVEAFGIDVSADAVAYCKKRGLKVSHGTIMTASLPKGKQFDVITAFEVIEHERDPLVMMRRVYKLLKNGGIALLTTPNHDSMWRKIMGEWWVGYGHPEHINFFNKQSLEELFRQGGFSFVSIKKDTPRPFPISFLFTRAADYFDHLGWLLRPIGRLFEPLSLVNPLNPWDDLIAFGRK